MDSGGWVLRGSGPGPGPPEWPQGASSEGQFSTKDLQELNLLEFASEIAKICQSGRIQLEFAGIAISWLPTPDRPDRSTDP